MKKFDYTADGYLKAKQYLINNNKWKDASTRGFSTDGFSIVHYANSLI